MSGRLQALDLCHEPQIWDLAEDALPIWTPEVQLSELLDRRLVQVARADALIFITPEWSGMGAPALKNFFLWCTRGELVHKPALLVGVSASVNGSYPIAELRMSSYKNTRVCYLPEQLVIRKVESVLNSATVTDEAEAFLRERIDQTLALLAQYTGALASVRQHLKFDFARFPYGM